MSEVHTWIVQQLSAGLITTRVHVSPKTGGDSAMNLGRDSDHDDDVDGVENDDSRSVKIGIRKYFSGRPAEEFQVHK